MTVPDVILEPSSYSEDLRFKAMRDLHRQDQDPLHFKGNGEEPVNDFIRAL
jgi:hypothetical protein